MSKSFVFGNGRSRLNIRFHELCGYGRTYACNAVYREFQPDFLVAVDTKMIMEIEKTGYQNTNQVWTNYNSRYKSFKNFNYFNPSLGWSSGPSALILASTHSADEIYIFGFDFVGIEGKLNNVYADTDNYKKSSDKATYYGNWQKQTETVIKNNKNIKYYRVVDQDYYDPNWKYDNFCHITYEELRKNIKDWQKS
jgi:hypothetical protein